jgi:putative ABC transport system substrate-binding protein
MKVWYLTLVFLVFSLIFFCSSSAASEKKVIGIIMIPNVQYYENIHTAFTETLLYEGITDDKVEIVIQKPIPDEISLMNTVRKFVAIDVDIIVSYGALSTLTAVDEQSEIPVVFAGVFDPHAVGISMKNATGISSKVPVLHLLEKLKSISNFSMLGVLYNNTDKETVLLADEIKRFEETLKFKCVELNIRRSKDTAKITGVDALLITTSPSVLYHIDSIVDIARKSKIPSASLIGGEEEKGVMLTLAANPLEQGRETARLVAMLLRGKKASSLPVVQSGKTDTVTNIKEALNLGLEVPLDLVRSSTKVIK